MKIRIKPGHIAAGPGVTPFPDGTADAPERVALAMIQAGVAEHIGPAPETAEAPASGETAEAPRAGPKPKAK